MSQAAWSVMLFHIVVFLALVPLFLGFFIWGLGQGTPWHFCQGHLMKGKRWNLEETFCHSDSVPSTFPLLSRPPHPLSTSEFIILKQPSVWDSLNICADPLWPSTGTPLHSMRWWNEESAFPLVLASCLYYHGKWFKGLTLSSVACSFNQPVQYRATQFSLSQLSWAPNIYMYPSYWSLQRTRFWTHWWSTAIITLNAPHLVWTHWFSLLFHYYVIDFCSDFSNFFKLALDLICSISFFIK